MALTMGQTAGSPYVTLTKTGTDGEYTVTRAVAGVSTPVRGTITVTGGTGTLVDREAPQATLVQYTSGGESTASTTTLSVGTYLIHPATQALDRQVLVGSWPDWSRDVRQDSVTPLGSRFPVVVSDVRQGRVGSGFTLILQDAAAATGLENLLNSTRLVLVSTNHYNAPYMWATVGEESWKAINPPRSTPYWMVTMTLTEVARPDVTSSGVVTWLDVANRYATWNDLAADYPTWESLIADSANWTS